LLLLATGTIKLPAFFIGKSKKPRCFLKKTGKELGFSYHFNPKAWITTILFQLWLVDFNEMVAAQNKRVLLLL